MKLWAIISVKVKNKKVKINDSKYKLYQIYMNEKNIKQRIVYNFTTQKKDFTISISI